MVADPTGLLSLIQGNPVLTVTLIMDVVLGLNILRQYLHPYLGNFDIALILQPLEPEGQEKAQQQSLDQIAGAKTRIKAAAAPSGRQLVAAATKKTDERKVWMIAGRVEFNPMKEAFRVGRGNDAFTYKVDTSKMAFIQRYHRVYYYEKGHAYPMTYSYAMNVRTTSSKGMDLFVAQKLWQQAVAATQKLNVALPIMVIIISIAAGAGLGFMIFYFAHPGFVVAGTEVTRSVTTGTTGTFGG